MDSTRVCVIPIGKRIEGQAWCRLPSTVLSSSSSPESKGLIHVSEISWTKRIKHPSKVVSVGDVVEAVVLDVSEKRSQDLVGDEADRAQSRGA